MATFACLGWGSLIWQPKDLPVRGPWRTDGPAVRVEFGRQSSDGRITLVIDPSAPSLSCLWTELKADSLTEARRMLRIRELIPARNDHHIGWWPKPSPGADQIEGLTAWAHDRGIDGIVWTALPPKIGGVERMPTADEVIDYLRSLPADVSKLAREYVSRAPLQISTQYRQRIELELGWIPTT